MSAPASAKLCAISRTSVGPGEVQKVVIALLVAGEVERAAIIGLGELPRLDLGPVGAVLDQDAPGGLGPKLRGGVHRFRFLGPEAEQMADRVGELGAIQRVEVEVADAARIELGAKLGGDGGGDELARAPAFLRRARAAGPLARGRARRGWARR